MFGAMPLTMALAQSFGLVPGPDEVHAEAAHGVDRLLYADRGRDLELMLASPAPGGAPRDWLIWS